MPDTDMSQTTFDPVEPFGPLSPTQRKLMSEIGARWADDILGHRDIVLDVYTPLAARSPKEGVVVTREIAYGDHPRNVVDVFSPARQASAAVVLYMHGGAFLRGKKRANEEIYDNVCYWFARQGIVAVNLEYRLAPETPYPGGAMDLDAAIGWCIANISRFGGDAGRLFLMGHSAGATHVATYVLDPAMGASPAPQVRGAVLVSGRLRADARPDNPNAAGVKAYFGTDESCYEARSPVTHVARSELPFLVAVAEFENPYLDVYGAEFVYRMALARRRSPDFIRMIGHNHTSMVAHFNSGEELLGRRILSFMQACP